MGQEADAKELEAAWRLAAMTLRMSGVGMPYLSFLPKPTPRKVCRVLITKPYADACVAERCLEVEGVTFDVESVPPSTDYSQQPEAYAGRLVKAWQDRIGFINLEHDVAPWPGALDQLWLCPEPFCFFRYPAPNGQLVAGIGCAKFGQDLLDAIPNSWEDWGTVPWWDLDGAIVSDILSAGFIGHEHGPPVAHVRRPMGSQPEPMK